MRPCSTARTIVAKLSSVRIIRPAFLATSVPLPIAIPMCAALIDGASLTPSPVIATTSPFFFSVSTSSTLCSGATRPTTPIWSIRDEALRLVQRGELGAEDRLALDAELLGDRGAGDHVVAGDHPHADVRLLGVVRPTAWTRRAAGRPSRRGSSSRAPRRSRAGRRRGRTTPGRGRGSRRPSRAARPPPSAGRWPRARAQSSSQGTLSPPDSALAAWLMTAGAAPFTKQRTTSLPDASDAFVNAAISL